LKKKKQKNFCYLARGVEKAWGPFAKVFCFFFSKKKRFLPSS